MIDHHFFTFWENCKEYLLIGLKVIDHGTIARGLTQEELITEQNIVKISVDDLESVAEALAAAECP